MKENKNTNNLMAEFMKQKYGYSGHDKRMRNCTFIMDVKMLKEDVDYIYKLCMESKTFAVINQSFYHYIKRQPKSITLDKISPKSI